MLYTNYEELKNAVQCIFDESQEAVEYICDGIYSHYGYEDIESGIRRYRKEEGQRYCEFKGLNNIFGTFCSWNVSHGKDIVELKNFYHDTFNTFGWPGIELASKDTLLGAAYYNAALLTNHGCNGEMCPSATVIFNELKKLVKRASYNGVVVKDNIKKYVEI